MGSPCSTYLFYHPFPQARQGPDTLSASSKLPHTSSSGSWHSALGYSLPVLPAAGALERLCNKNIFFFFALVENITLGLRVFFPGQKDSHFYLHNWLSAVHTENTVTTLHVADAGRDNIHYGSCVLETPLMLSHNEGT